MGDRRLPFFYGEGALNIIITGYQTKSIHLQTRQIMKDELEGKNVVEYLVLMTAITFKKGIIAATFFSTLSGLALQNFTTNMFKVFVI